MISINGLHHIGIICRDIEKSKIFYTKKLGLKVLKQTFRKETNSVKLDLALNGIYSFGLFSFPNSPQRITRPEATGLRHIAFEVENISNSTLILKEKSIFYESLRIDNLTNRQFTFIFDANNLPIELYEQ